MPSAEVTTHAPGSMGIDASDNQDRRITGDLRWLGWGVAWMSFKRPRATSMRPMAWEVKGGLCFEYGEELVIYSPPDARAPKGGRIPAHDREPW